jgi:hypothetical protein
MKNTILLAVLLMLCGCALIWDHTKPEPPLPPVAWGNLVGIGMFYGVMPWNGNGIYNDAPKDMPTLIKQFATAKGNLIQVQLLYEEGALFVAGNGLAMDPTKVAYCQNFVSLCRKQGVNVLFVLFDHCTLKNTSNPKRWPSSPLNKKNGGLFVGNFDIYANPSMVDGYVKEVVQKLNGENVAFEICNEGSDHSQSKSFAEHIRNTLQSVGVTRISTSGGNPGGLWKYSKHNEIHASAVKTGQLPNTDGQTWQINDVVSICAAVRATPESGFVWDGATDARHNWAEFLNAIKQ